MNKICYRPVYNRKKHLNQQGTALLQVEAYLNKRKVYFSTHIYLRPEQWDPKRKIIKCHPNANELNYMLSEFINKLEQKELEVWRKGGKVTLEALKEKQEAATAPSFLNFVKEEIKLSHVKASTKNNRESTYLILSKFKETIRFGEMTSRLIYEFEQFLFENGYNPNTIAKHMKHLRAFVNSAIDKGHIPIQNDPFRRYRIRTNEGKHAFLSPEELQSLENLELTGKNISLIHTLDAFLFCCYTGLRYSDFVNLAEENIRKINNEPWITLETIKTGAAVKLPLNLLFEGKAWKLLKKYKNNLKQFFAIKPNPTVNKELIRLGKLARIDKHFSFHTARHTNATLLIYKGANITTVQKLLGHRNISTTQIYSEIMESTIIKDLKKCSKSK